MKLNLALKTLTLAVILSAGTAMANHHEGGEHHNKMENHNKMEDYKKSADTNKDGKLTYDEYKMHNENRTKMKFEHMDANKDGTLDEAELKAIHDMGHGGKGCKHHDMQKEPAASKT